VASDTYRKVKKYTTDHPDEVSDGVIAPMRRPLSPREANLIDMAEAYIQTELLPGQIPLNNLTGNRSKHDQENYQFLSNKIKQGAQVR